MKNYKATIRPRSSFVTPLDSDTLFGSICWLIRWNYGEKKLNDFLAEYQDAPPLLISSGFQTGCIPMPVTKGVSRKKVRELVKKYYGDLKPKVMNEVIRLLKKINKEKYIPLSTFNEYIDNFSTANILEFILDADSDSFEDKYRQIFKRKKPFSTVEDKYHNMINRISNNTAEGQLFTKSEISFNDDIDIYLRFPESKYEYWQDILKAMEYEGFGGKKSTGKGQFSLVDFKEASLPKPKNPTHFITLANYVPLKSVPEGYYNLKIKRGKLGSIFSRKSYSPWKKPIVFYQPGSTFELDSRDRYYGGLISKVHHSKDEVVQYAYAFDLEVSLGE